MKPGEPESSSELAIARFDFRSMSDKAMLRQLCSDADLLRQRSRQQNVCDGVGTFDMAIVARIQFGDLPARSISFCCERSEERPRRISFRNAGNEGSWNAAFPIRWKMDVLLKATQTEIA